MDELPITARLGTEEMIITENYRQQTYEEINRSCRRTEYRTELKFK
jgi:hypothetical protein